MPDTGTETGAGADRGAGPAVVVCASSELIEGGDGVRFDVALNLGQRQLPATGFAIRHGGQVYAYLNQCAHVPMELDWSPGKFFDSTGELLMCSTHGASYRPDDGVCIAGPCTGQRLRKIVVSEFDRHVYWVPDLRVQPPGPNAVRHDKLA